MDESACHCWSYLSGYDCDHFTLVMIQPRSLKNNPKMVIYYKCNICVCVCACEHAGGAGYGGRHIVIWPPCIALKWNTS